ncbi:MAG: efflux RND transporter periplasmic adaptor subunit [Chitinophagaceae bacterium]|nr:efflux RND transporter periplasmic adaptor subunit [Chitinophagaceae bacterium]
MNINFFRALRFPIAAILAFALVKCGDNKAATTAGEKTGEDPIQVKLQPITTGNYSRNLQYSGLIASNAEARLSFKIGGIVSRIYVKEGDHVSKGQLLASLDQTEIDAQVQQASQNLDKSKRDESRISNLYRDTVASLEQLQNTRTQVSVATEALRIARFNQQYAQIHAPSGGAILQKLMNEGELATAGNAVFLFNGTDQRDWVVRFGVSDRDWVVLKKGDKATVYIEAYPGQTFTGIITKMAEGADPSNGTYPIEVTVSPAGHKLAPGLFCTLQLQPSSQQTLTLIPIEALVEGDGKTGWVYTVNTDGRTVRKHPIRIAFLSKDKVAVSEGLDNVDRVITEGVGYLTETSVVKVANDTTSK